MESEHQLQSVYGSKRPFSVPDDYFSRLPSRIMAQLPKEKSAAEKPYRVLVRRLRPLAAAAMTVGVVLTGFLAYSMFLSRNLQQVGNRQGADRHIAGWI